MPDSHFGTDTFFCLFIDKLHVNIFLYIFIYISYNKYQIEYKMKMVARGAVKLRKIFKS